MKKVVIGEDMGKRKSMFSSKKPMLSKWRVFERLSVTPAGDAELPSGEICSALDWGTSLHFTFSFDVVKRKVLSRVALTYQRFTISSSCSTAYLMMLKCTNASVDNCVPPSPPSAETRDFTGG
jgi:hypothetical protein